MLWWLIISWCYFYVTPQYEDDWYLAKIFCYVIKENSCGRARTVIVLIQFNTQGDE